MILHVGDTYIKEYVISDDAVKGFADISGDHNPIHIDDIEAKKSRFGKRVAHGMLIGAYISAILGEEFPGNGTIYLSQNIKFLKPVFIGEVISIRLVVKEIIGKKINLQTDVVLKETEETCVTGDAWVLYDECL